MASASALTEPTTLEEMHARYRAAQERNAASARRLKQQPQRPEPVVEPVSPVEPRRAPVVERRRPGPVVTATELRLAAILPDEADETHPKRIIARIAADYGVPAGAVTGKSQTRVVVAARFAAIAAVEAAHPTLSLSQLGYLFGKRDHTTILNALRRMDARRSVDEAGDEASAEAARELLCMTPDPEAILSLVAKAFGTTVQHIRGSSRSKRLIAPRRVAMVAIKAAHPLLSCGAIGRMLNREHSSVTRALKLHEQARVSPSA